MKKFDLPSKLQVTVRVIGVVLGAEFLVRALYNSLAFELSTFQASTLNAFALVVISTPIIYFWVVKPYVSAYQNALNQIEYISCLDPLTKLTNRRLISVHVGKTLANAQRHGLHGALMVMDLDGFKPINDRHGHEAGDAVLVEISNACRPSCARKISSADWEEMSLSSYSATWGDNQTKHLPGQSSWQKDFLMLW